MHDNKQTYSIYITINNLDNEIKRTQIRSKTVLLNFLSMMKFENTHVKINIYYRATKIILKRE